MDEEEVLKIAQEVCLWRIAARVDLNKRNDYEYEIVVTNGTEYGACLIPVPQLSRSRIKNAVQSAACRMVSHMFGDYS